MHLYLARVLSDLLASPGSSYAQFYAVQHVLPPYSLHYYLLIVLMHRLPALWAEKITVCMILCIFVCGVRRLALANGSTGGILSLFSFAVALNWPLMMGFQNYILSLGLACWALGVWCGPRLPAATPDDRHRGGIAQRVLFVGLCGAAVVSHPLPLLLILAFAATDLALRAVVTRLRDARLRTAWRLDACTLAVASTFLLYLRVFTDKHRAVEDLRAHEGVLARARYFCGLHGLDFFSRNSINDRLVQFSLYGVLALCVTCAALAFVRRERREWQPAYTWLLATIAFTCVLPFLPDDLSGSKAVVSRLQVVTWIGAIAAASGLPRLGRRAAILFSAFAIAMALGTLALAQARLAPIAGRIAGAHLELLPATGRTGILLSAMPDDDASFSAVTYEPLHWQAVNYFRQSGAVLLNTPWMDSTWLPLAARPTLLTGQFSPWTMECYHCLRAQLVASAAVRAAVLPRVDFIVFVDQPGRATQTTLDQVLKAEPAYPWSCDRHDWFWLCRKVEGSLP